jgi:predicted permease
MRQVHRAILDKVRGVPGVIAAGTVRDLPFRGDGEPISFVPAGAQPATPDDAPRATLMFASDGFFSAMGIPLVSGRDLAPSDQSGAPVVFVVNKALVDKYYGGANPVGRTISLGDTTQYTIVGVVGDVRQNAVDEKPAPRIYASVSQIFRVRTGLVVRTQGDPAVMTRRVMDAIRSVEPQQTFNATFTLDEALGEAVARPRLLTALLGLFGLMGLVLGALGLYGVLSFIVTQRTREIGVRLALGAQPREVLGMVVRRGLVLGGAGVVLGLAGSFALTRLMQSVLFGIDATDPMTFGGVAVVLLVVAALASLVPAVRATRIDPLAALRAD